MAQQTPPLKVSPEARGLINDIHYDDEFYASYLLNRSVPEEDLASLELHIDDKYMAFGSHGVYSARETDDPDSKHIIGFSPTRMPSCPSKQGALLRHETEHFIYQVEHPNHLRNRTRLVIGCTAIGAAMGAALGVQSSIELTKDLPLAVDIPVSAAAILGLTGVGALNGLLPSAMAHVAFGPSEIKAMWASRTRKLELPDGVLQVQFR